MTGMSLPKCIVYIWKYVSPATAFVRIFIYLLYNLHLKVFNGSFSKNVQLEKKLRKNVWFSAKILKYYPRTHIVSALVYLLHHLLSASEIRRSQGFPTLDQRFRMVPFSMLHDRHSRIRTLLPILYQPTSVFCRGNFFFSIFSSVYNLRIARRATFLIIKCNFQRLRKGSGMAIDVDPPGTGIRTSQINGEEMKFLDTKR